MFSVPMVTEQLVDESVTTKAHLQGRSSYTSIIAQSKLFVKYYIKIY